MTPLIRRWVVPVALLAVLAGAAAGSAGSAAADIPMGAEPGLVQPVPRGSAGKRAPAAEPVIQTREGRPAARERIRFRPQELRLSRGGRAEVQPAATVEGELQVPENVQHLGWWDGGAQAGDPFGSVVIAGHVDSRDQGLGFFVRLLQTKAGDEVVMHGDGHRLRYRVTAVKTITKEVLAADGQAFDQRGKHRLVLITCAGNYRADRGGYDSNLIIYAEPLGLAR